MRDQFLRYLKNLGILAVLAAILWVFGWGYWHLMIHNAILNLDRDSRPGLSGTLPRYYFPQESVDTIQDAGSRALPYLAESLTPKRSIVHLYVAGEWIRKALDPDGSQRRLRPFTLEDTPELLEAKCKDHQQAWKAFGAPKHRWWLWWKATELPPIPDPYNFVR
jgi:hypothetical protein